MVVAKRTHEASADLRDMFEAAGLERELFDGLTLPSRFLVGIAAMWIRCHMHEQAISIFTHMTELPVRARKALVALAS